MRLAYCRLITLAACDTHRGENLGDEGTLSIAWGFVQAGASAIVTTAWRVNDAAGEEVMTRFYRRLVEHPEEGKRPARSRSPAAKPKRFSRIPIFGCFR